MTKTTILSITLLGLSLNGIILAQSETNSGSLSGNSTGGWLPLSFHGSLQSDILFPESVEGITYSDKVLTNTYADLQISNQYLGAGARFEYLDHPLPGFENDFAGWGVPYFYLTGSYKKVTLTVGDFYDQFGSGFIFRTYEDRSLGIDNSLRGGRLVAEPFKGLHLKVVGGQQRRYWHHNDGCVWGADAELSIDRYISSFQQNDTYLTLGGSFVSRNEPDEEILSDPSHRYNLPKNVGAYDIRARLQKGNYSFLIEWAQKGQDPSLDNNYIYRKGSAFLFSGSYSKKGMSVLLQAKRSDNMSYRSSRSMSGSSSFINNLPAFAFQHTYALAALYPYATQPFGEWAFQGEAGYNFKRNTSLGGKYGTNLKLNASHIRSLRRKLTDNTEGYTSSFFQIGNKVYYQDINLNVEKKLTRSFKLNLMYMNQRYNKTVVEDGFITNPNSEDEVIKSNIFIADGKYQINSKMTVRGELQYLSTSEDMGDWAYALVEFSILPYWMISISDMYNVSRREEYDYHFYNAALTFNYKAHRIMGGYARTRAGFNCAGGVCRYVPASKGFQLSYNFTF